MAEIIKITEEIGEELAECGDSVDFEGHTYTYVDRVEGVEEHRWNSTDEIIFEREDNKLFAMLWDVGLTENQESGFVYNNPELYEVTKKEVVKTVTSYERVE